MPYIIITSSDGQELARRDLKDLVLIGRSHDCDVRIHDIMLSREHLGLEKRGGQWEAVDLDSRNGTFINGERITRHVLNDGDVVKAGRTEIAFFTADLASAAPARRSGLMDRPADPFEALSSTVVDYEFDPKFEPPIERPIRRPTPRPMPVANRSAVPSLATISTAVRTHNELGSSPTWATKPELQRPRPAVQQYIEAPPAPASAIASAIASAPAHELPAAAEQKVWKRRVGILVAETLATAALVGTTLLGALVLLS